MSVQIVVSWLCHCAILEMDTHILEVHGASVFRVNQEDGGSIFISLKCLYLIPRVHNVTTQNLTI